VDKQGKTVDFLLRRDRGIAAAQAFFRKALATNPARWPRKVTLDGHYSELPGTTAIATGESEVEVRGGTDLQVPQQYR
jgi:transposase-like protein